jgi:hypothetical protein
MVLNKFLAVLLFPIAVVLYPIFWIHGYFFPDYFIYTHRRGWIHCSKATKQDFEEMSGFMPNPPPLN